MPVAQVNRVLSGKGTLRGAQAERRGCVLAGRGRTNREIAGELFIAVSTVEQHLTCVYRKLQVKRRQDLHQELASGRYVVEEAQPPPQALRAQAAARRRPRGAPCR
ncbi:helix-turn-helix domain-containing protein [Streptomyces inhibens]|uniref:helix-turn-helix domain-containing protein n=1 Tax=Streptomyces inhibens TaxID=2293571 RepID=UPI003CCA0EA4